MKHMLRRLAAAAACILVAMGALGAEIVRVPSLREWQAASPAERSKLEAQLGPLIPERLAAGFLTPGEHVDTQDPLIAFALQFNRWANALVESQELRTQGLHYPEVVEWDKLLERWDVLKRTQKRRHQGQ